MDEKIQLHKARFYSFYFECHEFPEHTSGSFVKRVFDNYIIDCIDSKDSKDSKGIHKLIEILRFVVDELIMATDPFKLFNVNSLTLIMNLVFKYQIILSEMENNGEYIRKILEYIDEKGIQVKEKFLNILIDICCYNLEILSPVSQSISISQHQSASILTFDSLYVRKTNIYQFCITWIYTKFKSRNFWLTNDYYIKSIRFLHANEYLTDKECSFISQTLKLFIKSSLLLNGNEWIFEFEIIKSLNLLKTIALKAQQNPEHANCCWLKKTLLTHDIIYGNMIKNNRNLLIIDGANLYYNPKNQDKETNLYENHIKSINSQAWWEVIYTMIGKHVKTNMGVTVSTEFIDRYSLCIVLNERYRSFIESINLQLLKYIIFVPRGYDDDAMCISLWLSHPGSLLISNDTYSNWIGHCNNNYMKELWNIWMSCLKLTTK